MKLDGQTIITFISIAVALIGVSVTILLWVLSQLTNSKDRLGKIEGKFEQFETRLIKCEETTSVLKEKVWYNDGRLNILEKTFGALDEKILQIYLSVIPNKKRSNPMTPEEKAILLEKYKNRTLTLEEAKKLKQLFEEEEAEMLQQGKAVEAIIIGLVIAGLIFVAYKLFNEEI